VTYRQRITLTPDAVVHVKLVDISGQDAPAVIFGEQIIKNPGQVPIPFEISYDPTAIDPRHTYDIAAHIIENGQLIFKAGYCPAGCRGSTPIAPCIFLRST